MRSLSRHLFVDDRWLAHQGVDRASVLEDGRILTLNRTTNTHQGGLNFAITSLMSDALKDLSVRAAAAIPGLRVVGMDLMVKSLESSDDAIVVEANPNASLLLHHYPAFGKPVDVAAYILDAMERDK